MFHSDKFTLQLDESNFLLQIKLVFSVMYTNLQSNNGQIEA